MGRRGIERSRKEGEWQTLRSSSAHAPSLKRLHRGEHEKIISVAADDLVCGTGGACNFQLRTRPPPAHLVRKGAECSSRYPGKPFRQGGRADKRGTGAESHWTLALCALRDVHGLCVSPFRQGICRQARCMGQCEWQVTDPSPGPCQLSLQRGLVDTWFGVFQRCGCRSLRPLPAPSRACGKGH